MDGRRRVAGGRGGEIEGTVSTPNTNNPISAPNAVRSTEFRARHCAWKLARPRLKIHKRLQKLGNVALYVTPGRSEDAQDGSYGKAVLLGKNEYCIHYPEVIG